MLTKSIKSPGTGFGVRTFVRDSALQNGYKPEEILVICKLPELCQQFENILPGAQTVTAIKWRYSRHKLKDFLLVIVDEMPQATLERIMQSLQELPNNVWLINNDLPEVKVVQTDVRWPQIIGRVTRSQPAA